MLETLRMMFPLRRFTSAFLCGAPTIRYDAPTVAAMSTIVSAGESLIADRFGASSDQSDGFGCGIRNTSHFCVYASFKANARSRRFFRALMVLFRLLPAG